MNRLPIGIQLYNLRQLLEGTPENFGEVLRWVKALGYEGVEFAGFYGIEPARIRQMLEETGLTAVNALFSFTEMEADLDKIIEDCKTIGVKYIGLLYLPEELRPGTDKFDYVLESIRTFAEKSKAAGLPMLYHNHCFEFYKMDNGEYALDMMYRTIPAGLLQAELDTCWVRVSGEDPAEYLKKYSGRCPVVHLKDYYMEGDHFEFRPLGDGQQDCKSILNVLDEVGTEWIIVEQDEPSPAGPMADAKRSIEYCHIFEKRGPVL